jgi:hypothetical protein
MAAGLGFKDFVTGEVLTAADVDSYLMQGIWVFASAAARDAAVTSPQEGNFAYLKDTNVTTYYTGSAWANLDTTGMTNPMTTTGDTIYSSSGSTPARLGIGSTGQVLTVAGGIPSWATPAGGSTFVGVKAQKNATQSIANNTDTVITFAGTDTFDTNGYHDPAVNNTRFTIPSGKGGYYLVTGNWGFASNATGNRECYFNLNGSFGFNGGGISAQPTSATVGTYSAIVNLSVGDYIEMYVNQTSGGALNANTSCLVSMQFLGA